MSNKSVLLSSIFTGIGSNYWNLRQPVTSEAYASNHVNSSLIVYYAEKDLRTIICVFLLMHWLHSS